VRYIAIDIGDKRTGIAVGDSETSIVSPREVLEVPIVHNGGADLIAAIAKAVADVCGPWQKCELVVGLPLNMDGSEGPQAKKSREVGVRIGEATKRLVHYQDERLTSVEADWSMAQSGLTHGGKKARRDALAAAAILRDFLAARSRGGRGDGNAPLP
jgi:putative Holliday junction resolvase